MQERFLALPRVDPERLPAGHPGRIHGTSIWTPGEPEHLDDLDVIMRDDVADARPGQPKPCGVIVDSATGLVVGFAQDEYIYEPDRVEDRRG